MSVRRLVRIAATVALVALCLGACDIFESVRSPLDPTVDRKATTELVAGGAQGSANGTGSAAQFSSAILGMCSDGTSLYVSDTNNQSIRKVVVATGVVTTLSTGASIYGVCTDGTNLYGADPGGHCIYKIPVSGGAPSVFAGSAGTSGNADGTGTSARFSSPHAICIDSAKNYLYVSDWDNGNIRRIVVASAAVTTLATGLANPESVCLVGNTLTVNTTGGTSLVDLTSGAVTNPTIVEGQTVYGFHAYDGSDFLYKADGDSITKVQTSTSPWGVLWAKSSTNKSLDAACFCGADLYLADSGNYGIYKLVSIK